MPLCPEPHVVHILGQRVLRIQELSERVERGQRERGPDLGQLDLLVEEVAPVSKKAGTREAQVERGTVRLDQVVPRPPAPDRATREREAGAGVACGQDRDRMDQRAPAQGRGGHSELVWDTDHRGKCGVGSGASQSNAGCVADAG